MSKGYVYILTNPYFRKGIVKIGMSKRPVDTRSKELYNTSVPDRFEEFASISTVKFKEVEKLIHAILTKLTHKRVNEDREFFKIKPEAALDVFRDVSKVIDDAEIVVKGEPPKAKGKKPVAAKRTSSSDILFCRGSGSDARGRINGDEFVVLKGSRISPKVVLSFEKRAHGCFIRRNELEADGSICKGVFTKDVVFTSPTVAANIVQGHNSNGQWDWRSTDGRHLCEIRRRNEAQHGGR